MEPRHWKTETTQKWKRNVNDLIVKGLALDLKPCLMSATQDTCIFHPKSHPGIQVSAPKKKIHNEEDLGEIYLTKYANKNTFYPKRQIKRKESMVKLDWTFAHFTTETHWCSFSLIKQESSIVAQHIARNSLVMAAQRRKKVRAQLKLSRRWRKKNSN